MSKSQLETDFLTVWRLYGPTGYDLQTEHPFRPWMWSNADGWRERRWKFDAAIPTHWIAIELEGMAGRHQTMQGFRQDVEKYTVAASKGWRVLRFVVNDITSRPEWVVSIIEDTISEVEQWHKQTPT